MEQSTNYNFNLPSKNDETSADVDLISDNFKKIDEVMKQNSDLGVELNKKDEELQAQIDALEVGGGGATNLVNGSAKGSLRGIGAKAEDIEYTIGEYAVALGYKTTASGYCSYAEGFFSTASGSYSHAEGTGTASGDSSHSEGGTASGNSSHSEGLSTASGSYSHSEGNGTESSGYSSHAEGQNTVASGYASHAEGQNAVASDTGSHAEGENTIASSSYQHVQGRYNIKDESGKYAHIVGNGSFYYGSPHRSNAHTLDWNGNAWFAGDVYVGGTSQDDDNATKLSSVATDISQVKAKLDGIEEGANKTIVDSELSDTSTNPVQNKVVSAKIKNHASFFARRVTANTVYINLGKFTGDNGGGKAIITISGNPYWGGKGDGGFRVLTLSSNTYPDISSTDIHTGASLYDFGQSNYTGTEIVDDQYNIQVALVRPNGYSVAEVDVYLKFNNYQYNSYLVTVDYSDGCSWVTSTEKVTTSDPDPMENALSAFIVPKRQIADLTKFKTKADIETGTCTLTAYSNTVFGGSSRETLLNWRTDTSKYYTTGSVNADGTLTVQGTGNARIINAYNINATGTVGVEFAVSGTGTIKIEIKGGGKIYTSGNISLSTTTQKIQITHATSGIAVLDDMEINIYVSGETSLKIENLLKMTEASTRTLTGNYDLIGNQVTVSVLVDNLQNDGEITLYPLPFVPKFAKSGVCGAFSSSSYSSAIYYDIDGTTARIYLNDAPQSNKQLTFTYTV